MHASVKPITRRRTRRTRARVASLPFVLHVVTWHQQHTDPDPTQAKSGAGRHQIAQPRRARRTHDHTRLLEARHPNTHHRRGACLRPHASSVMSTATGPRQWTVKSGKVAPISFSEEPPTNGADATCQWKARLVTKLFKSGCHVVTVAPSLEDNPVLCEVHEANGGEDGKVFARHDEGPALLMRQLCASHPLADSINQETSGLKMVGTTLAHAGVTPLVLATFHARHMTALGFAKGGEKEPSKRFEHLAEQTNKHHRALPVVVELQRELLPSANDASTEAQDKQTRHMTMRQLLVPECLRVAILASKVQTDAVLRSHANVMRAVAERLAQWSAQWLKARPCPCWHASSPPSRNAVQRFAPPCSSTRHARTRFGGRGVERGGCGPWRWKPAPPPPPKPRPPLPLPRGRLGPPRHGDG